MWYGKIIGAVLLVSALGGCAVTGGTTSLSPLAMNNDPALLQHMSEAMPVGQQVVPPIGYIGYCLRNAEQCAGGNDRPVNPELTAERWSQLNEVNEYVNRNIPQREDDELYQRAEWWAVAGAQGGDCEDLAMLKQKLLIDRGWPADSLLITVVREWNGEGHAVLVVETDKGEYILDNKNWQIVAWVDTPYTWVKRQSRERPYIWVNLDKRSFRHIAMQPLPPVGTIAPFVTAALANKALKNRTLTELRPAQMVGETSSLNK
ncbi:MAG: transglutaminase-like cysteine peptidase [Parvibaculum sp.]